MERIIKKLSGDLIEVVLFPSYMDPTLTSTNRALTPSFFCSLRFKVNIRNLLLIFLLLPLFGYTQDDTLLLPTPELIPFKIKSKFGYANQNGKMVIKSSFDFAEPFFEDCLILNSVDSLIKRFGTSDYATVARDKRHYRISKNGQIVCTIPENIVIAPNCIKAAMDVLMPGANIIFFQNGKYGVKKCDFYKVLPRQIDTLLHNYPSCIIIQPKYELIKGYGYLNKEPFIAKLNGKYGLIKKYDQIVVGFKYDSIEYLSVALLKVRKGKEVYYIDYIGNEYKR